MVVRVGLMFTVLMGAAGCADGGKVAPSTCEEGATMPCSASEPASPTNQYICVAGEWISMCAELPTGGSGG